MLEKYCIKGSRRKSSLWSIPVNTEYIVNKHIEAKGSQKNNEDDKVNIKEDLKRVSYQDELSDSRPFFEITSRNISKFEKLEESKQRPRSKNSYRQHPIMSMFDQKSCSVV